MLVPRYCLLMEEITVQECKLTSSHPFLCDAWLYDGQLFGYTVAND